MLASDYLQQLRQLMADGAAWLAKEDDTTVTGQLLTALAQEPARVDGRAQNLLTEADPKQTVELLADWERDYGLPDACFGTLPTFQERRNALLFKIRLIGRQDPAFFIELAAALGFTITITEFLPFTCESGCDDPLYDDDWRFYWQVNATANAEEVWFDTLSGCDEPLRSWGNAQLECLLNSVKPAHTEIIFVYD